MRALLAALGVISVLSASCAAPPPPAAGPSRPLIIGIVGEPASLLGDDPAGRAVAAAVTEPLVRRTATEDLEPRLAASVPTLANGDVALVEDPAAPGGRLVARFRLRDGARWHDGTSVTADDVRFGWEHDRAAAAGSEARTMAERVDSVDVIDDRTVRVSYRAGERWDLYALAPRALPRHLLLGASADARERYASRPVHAGPYRIADRSGGAVTLEAFAEHVIARPQIDRIVVRSFPTRTALVAALLGGDVDVAPSPGLEADLAATLDRSFGDRVSYKQAQAIAMLRFGPRFADPLVRLAITHAIDRDRIARTVFGGRARVPVSYLVAPLWAANDLVAPVRFDRDRARAIMAAAGATRGGFGIAELRGDRLVVALLVPQGSTALEQAARGIAVDLAVLGIAVEVSERPHAEIEERVQRGGHDLALVIDQADDPLLASERYRGRVSDWFDVLGDAARASPDRVEKRAIYAEMQRLWADSAPAVPLFQVLKVDIAPVRMDRVQPASHTAPITWNIGEWKPLPR